MDAHGTPEYSTATGNDYAAHEGTYKGFTFLVLIGICYVISLTIALAVGGVKGAWGTEAALIILASIVAAHGLMTGSKIPSYVMLVLSFLALAFA
jgi:Bacterial aa3 type cytochrome c oxidase subunit IV